jgi:hypothetical protein
MMNPDEEMEGNKLIAEFLEWEKRPDDKFMFPSGYPVTGNDTGHTLKGIEDAEFHKSFDWLVPVIRKAIALKIARKLNKVMKAWGEMDIEKSWSEMVAVVQWYNQNSSKAQSTIH